MTANETYLNQTIVVEGNVFVRSPGQLTLINVTLEINSTAGTRRGLLVESGATLRTRDTDNSTLTSLDRTTVRPLSSSERIWFVAAPGASIDLRQSALWGVGYTQSPANASGVYIQTNSTILHNVSVFSGYFGVVFLGVVGNFSDLSVHNNTYNGLDMDASCDISVRGLLVADNGQAGVHASGGRFAVVGASVLHNGDGLAVKFGGRATASLFDVSGNANGFIVLNGATLNLSQGRVTNNTAAGVDARQTSVVNLDTVTLSDNPNELYGSLGTAYTVVGGNLARGIHTLQLRSASSASLTGLRIEGTTGDALDLDQSSADIFSTVFDGNAFGGTVSRSTSFAFLDSVLSNCAGGGFTFDNSTGVYLHNPAFINNKGKAVALIGATTSLIDATGVAEVNRSVVEVRSLSIVGTLRLVDATVHAVSNQPWSVTGVFQASNTSVIGDFPGTSLTLQGGAAVLIRGLTIRDIDFRLNGASPSADIDLLILPASGELALTGGDSTWRNVTQGAGAGRIRASAGNLTLIGGSSAVLAAEGTGRIDLRDFAGALGSALYAASGQIRQFWTVGLFTQWQSAAAAPNQLFSIEDATAAPVASGQTDGTGTALIGLVLVGVGSTGGVTSLNPHVVSGGSGAWSTTVSLNFTGAATYPVTLIDGLPPSLAILTPTQGASVSGNAVNITGNAADGESGLEGLGWSFDNVSFTPGTPAASFVLQVPTLFETLYLVTLRAADLAGNLAFAQVSFRVDRTAPLVSLSQPTNGSSVKGPTVRFVGGTELGATVTINGTAVALDAAGDFDANLSLPDGLITVGVTAVDAAGNVFFREVQLRVDSTPPGIAVFSPPNGSTVAARTVDLVGFLEPGSSFYINGVGQLALANGSFNITVDLDSEGANLLVLRSVDAAGNSNQTEWVVVRDTRAPAVTVAELTGPGPFAVNASSPHFTITTDEDAFIQASVSPAGATSSGSGTSMVFISPTLAEGSYTLTVRATDQGGNTASHTYAFRVDLTAPTFALDNRTEAGFVNTTTWKVSLSAEAGANVTVGGVPAAPTSPGSSTFEATVALQPGANSITIVVVDAAGNRATRTITLTLDQTPPALTLTAPAAGASTGDGQIEVSGTTEPGATVIVMGRPVPTDGAGHFATVVNIPVGPTTVTVTATDLAGNRASVERAVTRTSGSSSLGIPPFLQENFLALLLLIVLALVAVGLAARSGTKKRALKDKAAALEREMETSRAARNDLNALENFSPAGVEHKDFVTSDEFRRKQIEAERSAVQDPARK